VIRRSDRIDRKIYLAQKRAFPHYKFVELTLILNYMEGSDLKNPCARVRVKEFCGVLTCRRPRVGRRERLSARGVSVVESLARLCMCSPSGKWCWADRAPEIRPGGRFAHPEPAYLQPTMGTAGRPAGGRAATHRTHHPGSTLTPRARRAQT
jgi:hypothetical protein